MKMHNGVQLSDVEYEELLTLAEAADNGEDVMLTAFMRLCPTGQEGAFDESVVAAYAALADLGFIEGVQEGGEFFFEDITPAGRSLTNPSFARNRGDESALFGEAASFDEPAAFDEPIDVAAEDAQSAHERDVFSTNMPSRSRISKPKRPKRMAKAKVTTKRSKKLANQPKLRPMKHLAARLRRFSKAPQPNKPLLRVPWRALSRAPSPQPSCASCCKRAL